MAWVNQHMQHHYGKPELGPAAEQLLDKYNALHKDREGEPERVPPSQPCETAFRLAGDMEDDIAAARDFAEAIVGFATFTPESHKDRSVLVRLAYTIDEHCESIEERRQELHKILNPNRDVPAEVNQRRDNHA